MAQLFLTSSSPESCAVLLIRVVEDDQRKPEFSEVLVSQGVEGDVLLQVVIAHSLRLLPFETDLELQMDGMASLLNLDDLHQGDGDVDLHLWFAARNWRDVPVVSLLKHKQTALLLV